MARPSLVAQALDLALTIRRTLLLLGPPGCGKSQLVAQAAARNGYRLIDTRLAQKDPVDIMGGLDTSGPFTRFKPPAWLPLEPVVGDERVCLFLDEFDKCSVPVQNAALELLNDRAVGGVPLGPNVAIIGAANRIQDRAGGTKLTTAAARRWASKVDVETDLDEWLAWASGAGILPSVTSFLRVQPQYLDQFKPDESPLAYPCPASWEHVSALMAPKPPLELALLLCRGAVGEAAGASFVKHEEICAALVPPADILANPGKVKLPEKTSPAALYGTCAALASYLRSKVGTKDLDKLVAALFVYLDRIPAEFAICCVIDCLNAGVHVSSHPKGQQFALTHKDVILRGLAPVKAAA